ncbi:MAG TPA: hypothetical protein VKZ18_15250 [Polyangia bacterium]|nr:hypothetical protein [Polyangia bacterium]
MDFQLAGALIAGAAATPYVVEVLRQVPLQARVMEAMPPAARAALPPHPRRPWLTVFGSTRFFLALFRWALRDQPDDSPELAALKRRMRWSALREWLFMLVFAAALVLLLRAGWRPLWPRLPR